MLMKFLRHGSGYVMAVGLLGKAFGIGAVFMFTQEI